MWRCSTGWIPSIRNDVGAVVLHSETLGSYGTMIKQHAFNSRLAHGCASLLTITGRPHCDDRPYSTATRSCMCRLDSNRTKTIPTFKRHCLHIICPHNRADVVPLNDAMRLSQRTTATPSWRNDTCNAENSASF